MALNGVNLPLSFTGQGAVWQTVGRRLGWKVTEMQDFLAAIGRTIFDGMKRSDPKAIWVLQSWPAA